MDFKDQIVVLLGAGGMGQQFLKDLYAMGVRSFFVADSSTKNVMAVDSWGGWGSSLPEPTFLDNRVIDISSKHERDWFVNSIQESAKRPSILIYTIGVTSIKGQDRFSDEWPIEDIEKVFDINLLGFIDMAHRFTKSFFVPQKYGRIIGIASMAGIEPMAGGEIYGATKAGMIGYIKAFARRLTLFQKEGIDIRINALTPRMVVSPMTEAYAKKERVMKMLCEHYKQSSGFSSVLDVSSQVIDLLKRDAHGEFVDEKGTRMHLLMADMYNKVPII